MFTMPTRPVPPTTKTIASPVGLNETPDGSPPSFAAVPTPCLYPLIPPTNTSFDPVTQLATDETGKIATTGTRMRIVCRLCLSNF
jgi:hypothetical protein